MATSNINVRIDSDLKTRSTEILNSLGLDMSTAINIYLRQIVDFNGIPFPVQKRYNAETEQAIREARQGKNLIGPFNSIEDFWNAVDSEDDDATD